jgi:hypothetical protein
MVPRIKASWWESVTLLREPAVTRGRVAELFRGELCEAVYAAMERPEEERSRLVLVFTASQRRVDWPEIAALAARPDFPALI